MRYSPPKIGVTLDCPDPEVVAVFWEKFLGYQRRPGKSGGPYVTLERPEGGSGPAQVAFQRVPEPKTSKARVHMDLFVEHARPIMEEMITAGARSLETIEAGEWTTRILQDPAGNEFCLIGPD